MFRDAAVVAGACVAAAAASRVGHHIGLRGTAPSAQLETWLHHLELDLILNCSS